ncbi:hypothetical protein EIN_168650 [Entamoeba invadens IP1]|uniref:EF-hand domain-containing protein n=1 Tax=Entamoeba invadens IP1 TaxID=370355 RepID=A0A0A1TY59_ENTIV|nr:hypothetical protein EIN_168650 [Entamoeba invadens IP1]ELP84470.1 hypothetical protein EIN_168650 [Entamoeba invadens IP1]|eukprot:XP_004183816.1 hypothetical protein EIN_168650 [Entamoeba invadens IP1]
MARELFISKYTLQLVDKQKSITPDVAYTTTLIIFNIYDETIKTNLLIMWDLLAESNKVTKSVFVCALQWLDYLINKNGGITTAVVFAVIYLVLSEDGDVTIKTIKMLVKKMKGKSVPKNMEELIKRFNTSKTGVFDMSELLEFLNYFYKFSEDKGDTFVQTIEFLNEKIMFDKMPVKKGKVLFKDVIAFYKTKYKIEEERAMRYFEILLNVITDKSSSVSFKQFTMLNRIVEILNIKMAMDCPEFFAVCIFRILDKNFEAKVDKVSVMKFIKFHGTQPKNSEMRNQLDAVSKVQTKSFDLETFLTTFKSVLKSENDFKKMITKIEQPTSLTRTIPKKDFEKKKGVFKTPKYSANRTTKEGIQSQLRESQQISGQETLEASQLIRLNRLTNSVKKNSQRLRDSRGSIASNGSTGTPSVKKDVITYEQFMDKAKELYPNFEKQQDDFDTMFYFGSIDFEYTVTLEMKDFIFKTISNNTNPRGLMPTAEDMCTIAYRVATFGGKKGLNIDDYMRIRQRVVEDKITREDALESFEYYDHFGDNILNEEAFVNCVNEEQPIDKSDPPNLVEKKMKRYAFKVFKREDKDHSTVFGQEKFCEAMRSVIRDMKCKVTENDEIVLLVIYRLKESGDEIDSKTFMNLVVMCLKCFNIDMTEGTLNYEKILKHAFYWFVPDDEEKMSLSRLELVLEKLKTSIESDEIAEFLERNGCENYIFLEEFIMLLE